MSSALDMSLDDIIKSNRKPTGSRGRGGVGGGAARGSGGPGPARRFSNRVGNRAAPYSRPVQAPDSAWQHDMFAADTAVAEGFGARPAGGASSIETGTKLYISNLDYGVSNEDIKELFSEVGDLKRYGIHYDRSGRSKGTAEVVFSRRGDAMAAVKRYNNVQLDGKPMKVEIVGTNLSAPAPPPLPANGMFGNLNGAPRRGRGRGSFVGRLRGGIGGGRGARGGGRGRGRGRDEKISAEDLDADLDNYHKVAMETEGNEVAELRKSDLNSKTSRLQFWRIVESVNLANPEMNFAGKFRYGWALTNSIEADTFWVVGVTKPFCIFLVLFESHKADVSKPKEKVNKLRRKTI